MDDLMGKIQEMLSDEESMKQIQELADMLSSASSQQENQKCNFKNNNTSDFTKNESNNSANGFDIGMIFKLQELMSSVKSDKDAELILALKPHLNAEKQQKADKALKLMKIISLLETLKSSGLLNDFDKII